MKFIFNFFTKCFTDQYFADCYNIYWLARYPSKPAVSKSIKDNPQIFSIF